MSSPARSHAPNISREQQHLGVIPVYPSSWIALLHLSRRVSERSQKTKKTDPVLGMFPPPSFPVAPKWYKTLSTINSCEL